MPHSPLNTDEKLDKPVKRKRDMDSTFLAGCLSVAFLSLFIWGIAAWPFFVFPVHLKEGLTNAALAGCLPALIIGAISVIKGGLTGATGFAGGGFSVGLFVYLHLQSKMLGDFEMIDNLAKPDYPVFWSWLLPLIWCLVVSLLILFLMPKSEFEDEAAPGSNR